jgi:formate dehydrogenase iron-sulfur subunit
VKVRVSDDAVALACGADAVAAAFAAAGCQVERVSSWGMHWLEPLVDIDGVGYGPVTLAPMICASAPLPSIRSSRASNG